MRGRVLLVSFVAAGVAIVPTVSDACTCTRPSIEEEYSRASEVFLGTAEEVRRVQPGWFRWPSRVDPRLGTRVRFRVLARWKGDHDETEVVWTASIGAACGYRFHRGATYLVYAIQPKDRDHLEVDLCSRTEVAECVVAHAPTIGPPVWQARGFDINTEYPPMAEPVPLLPCVRPPRLTTPVGVDWPMRYPCVPVDMVVDSAGSLVSFTVNLEEYESRCQPDAVDGPLHPLEPAFLEDLESASRGWAFAPATLNGVPVSIRLESIYWNRSPISDGWNH